MAIPGFGDPRLEELMRAQMTEGGGPGGPRGFPGGPFPPPGPPMDPRLGLPMRMPQPLPPFMPPQRGSTPPPMMMQPPVAPPVGPPVNDVQRQMLMSQLLGSGGMPQLPQGMPGQPNPFTAMPLFPPKGDGGMAAALGGYQPYSMMGDRLY